MVQFPFCSFWRYSGGLVFDDIRKIQENTGKKIDDEMEEMIDGQKQGST